MINTVKVLMVALLVLGGVMTSAVLADPCLVVYPVAGTYYHYDINEYYTVTVGDPLYDPMYDRGGEVLIDLITNEIAYNIYQADNVVGFKVSSNGQDGYFFIGSYFDLVIDGFSNTPTTYPNVILVFEPDPGYCAATITVDGNDVAGYQYPVGDLVVSTPTADGNNYSDSITLNIQWGGCYGMRMWAFADYNYDGVANGGECFSAFSHDSTVPTEERTWGAIKAMYTD